MPKGLVTAVGEANGLVVRFSVPLPNGLTGAVVAVGAIVTGGVISILAGIFTGVLAEVYWKNKNEPAKPAKTTVMNKVTTMKGNFLCLP